MAGGDDGAWSRRSGPPDPRVQVVCREGAQEIRARGTWLNPVVREFPFLQYICGPDLHSSLCHEQGRHVHDKASITGVPAGASAIIPRLGCRDPQAEVDFCVRAFGATIGVLRPGPDGRLAHAMWFISGSM